MDPYSILGIKKTNDRDTIRKAYLSQSMKWHPDKNPDNVVEATRRFGEINEAYEQITNSKNDSIDLDSIIDGLFGFINKKANEKEETGNILFDINVTLENLYCGTECLIEYNRKVIDESVTNEYCSECNGYGYQTISDKKSISYILNKNITCQKCDGSGFSGKLITTQQELNINIPPKTKNDEKLIFRGYGDQKLDGTKGDLIVQLVNYKHKMYERRGDDLYTTIDITFKDALLGFEKSINTLDGSSFKLNVKGPIKMGKVVKIKGKGMTENGSMFIKLIFCMPKKLSKEQIEAINNFF